MAKRRNIEKELRPWEPSDGEYIHLAALVRALPGFRWDLYLVGTSGSNKSFSKIRPLLGRTRTMAVVVLISSLQDWLTHYNQDKPAVVAGMIEDLRKSQREYIENLMDIRVEVRSKSGDKPGRKPSPPKVKQVGPLKVTSNDVFGVWG